MIEIRAGEPHEGNWYVLLAGLPYPSVPLALAPGVSRRPLKEKLTIFDWAAAGASGLQGWTAIEPFCAHCTAELESAKDANVTPGYDTLNRAWLVTVLLILRGFTKLWGVACSAYSWQTIAGHQNRTAEVFHAQALEEGIASAVHESNRALPQFNGSLLDYHLSILVDDLVRQDCPSEADANWISRHFDDFNRIASESSSFRFALEAAVDWRFAKDPRAAIARLWGGIESTFGISSELVYRISLLSACVLEPRGEPRKRRFDMVKKLYALRSKAVHGAEMTQEQLFGAMSDSFHLLRELILASIAKGRALTEKDFEDAVFV